VTNHPQVVVRAKSKRELIYTLARPHPLRSSERWLAASKKEDLIGLLWAAPIRGRHF